MKKKLLLLFLTLSLTCLAVAAAIPASAETEPSEPSRTETPAEERDGQTSAGSAQTNDPAQVKPTPRESGSAGKATVYGRAKITVSADAAIVRISLDARAGSAADAEKSLTEKADEIMDAVHKIDPEAKDTADRVFVYPVWEKDTAMFEASREMAIKCKTPEKAEQICNAGKDAGGHCCNVFYLLEDKKDAYNRALSEAKANAEQKAEVLLGVASAPKSVTEQCVYDYSDCEQKGMIVVEATVRARFSV